MDLQQPILHLVTPLRTFTVEDVLHWAEFSCRLTPYWLEFLAGFECLQRVNAEALEPDADAIQAMSEEWRYEHDLITSEETEAWLQARRVSMDDFLAWLERRYWTGQMQAKPPENPLPFTEATTDSLRQFAGQLAFSGALDEILEEFARRLVAFHHSASNGDATDPQRQRARMAFNTKHNLQPFECEVWLEKLGRDSLWWEEMIAMEACYQAEYDSALSSTRKEEVLQGLRLPLTRIHLDLVDFDTLDMAREARLCLMDDEQPLEELAAATGRSVRHICVFADALPARLQHRVLSALPGEILEPEEMDHGYQVCRVFGKVEPTADDEEVSARLERDLIAAAFEERCRKFVRLFTNVN